MADAYRIAQVVTNYLTNALKYSAEDARVEIGVTTEDQQARVWVRDEGPGCLPRTTSASGSVSIGSKGSRFRAAPGSDWA